MNHSVVANTTGDATRLSSTDRVEEATLSSIDTLPANGELTIIRIRNEGARRG